MSASIAANSKSRRSSVGKLWLGLLVLIAAGFALAWIGAGSLRGETTASGLKFRTVNAGSGPQIKAIDGVLIEYEGRLLDGTVFDSSEGRGPTPMIAGQVIPGFAEALGKMQKGGKYKIHIPGKLAYGDNPPAGSPFGKNEDLDFDVHIVQIVPNAALMTQGGEAPGGAQGGQAPQPEQAPQPQP